jgi:hypothetical protein
MIKEKMYFSENDDPIDIRYDNVFKAVFTRNTPESQGALAKLVSALIGREVTIVAITANEPPVDDLRDRQIRFDIRCRTKDNELVNVEMSLNPTKLCIASQCLLKKLAQCSTKKGHYDLYGAKASA